MRRIKAYVKAFAQTFTDLAIKVENKTATGEEAMAYGCLYIVIGVSMMVLVFGTVIVCSIISSLL